MKDRKGRCQFVVACVGDTPEVLEAGEEALDQVAVSERGWSKLRWVGRLERDGMTACAPVASDLRNEMIGIVVLVRDDGIYIMALCFFSFTPHKYYKVLI